MTISRENLEKARKIAGATQLRCDSPEMEKRVEFALTEFIAQSLQESYEKGLNDSHKIENWPKWKRNVKLGKIR